MMYSNRLVASIKVDGQILREKKDTVAIPFGSEYSILLKNLNSVRASVKISVDGVDATDGLGLVIDPNNTIELERFIRNGNLNAGNRFKFIERTEGIEQHRGIQVDDGLIRVEFQFEQPKQQEIIETIRRKHIIDEYEYPHYPWPRPYYPRPYWYSNTLGGGPTFNSSVSNRVPTRTTSASSGGKMRSVRQTKGSPLRSRIVSQSMPTADCLLDASDAGITVPGSESNQKFNMVGSFPLEEQKHVLILRLTGVVKGKAVVQAVTVKQKPTCSSCGRVNKATSNFCVTCGTSLTLI
jgi:hypothetical protein